MSFIYQIKTTNLAITNDPFEFAPNFEQSDKINTIQRLAGETWGVICGSLTSESIPMWSYYADGHRGMAIEYDTSKKPFTKADTKHHFPVDYKSPRPLLWWDEKTTNDELEELLLSIASKKSQEWDHEEEYRYLIDKNFIDIDSNSIKSITFGFRFGDVKSGQQIYIKEILEYLDNCNESIHFYQIRGHTDQYKIETKLTTKDTLTSELKILDSKKN